MLEPKRTWDEERIARLAFLIGRGMTGFEVACDRQIQTTAANVYQLAKRLNIHFRDVPDELTIALTPMATAAFVLAAEKRGISKAELLSRIAETCAAEPHLFAAVLDDGR